MNSRTLGILSAAALLVIAVAVWLGYLRSPSTTEEAKSLYPGLKADLGKVSNVKVFKAGDQIGVELTKDGSAWKIKQRYDYPADTSKVNALLIGLGDANIREQKTANPENYGALAVQDLSDASTSGVRVELVGAAAPVNLIVGKKDGGTRSTFVRRTGEKESWLIGTELDAPTEAASWLKKDLLNIGADRIQEVAIQAGTSSYMVFKNARADANFDVKGIPKGRELNSVSVANPVAQALSSLQLEDVRPAAEIASQKSSGRAEFRTFDGLVIECVGYTLDEHRWMVVKASFAPELAKRFHVATENKDGSPESATKAVEAEVQAINSSTANWAFALPAYKFDAIFKPIDDLLKKADLLKKK